MFRPRPKPKASFAAALLATVFWLGCAPEQSPITSVEDFDAALVMPEVDAQDVGTAIRAQTRHTDRVMNTRGVVAMAVGAASRGNGAAVQVYVEDSNVQGIPRELDGVPVEIIVTGPIVALQETRGKGNGKGGGGGGGGEEGGGGTDPTAKFPRPVPIGVSTGHPAITAGTIGARVTNGTEVYVLSNNHVYADANDAKINDAVIQPGTFDGGSSPADDIGTLKAFVPIDFSGGDNVVDAAIASTTTADLDNSTPSNGYGTPKIETAAASVGMRVMKYGRTTSQTKGRVQGIHATVNVNYGAAGVARFVQQIIIGGGGFSAGGDSGSLIVVQRGSDALKPIGLLFAGGGGVTIANPIDAVLSAFSVTIDGN